MRSDSPSLETFRTLFKKYEEYKKRTLKGSFFSRKPLETKRLPGSEVQLVIGQSNYLNNSNRDYGWLILACFTGVFTRLEKKVWFENSAQSIEIESK